MQKKIDLKKFTKLNLACGNIKKNMFPEPWFNIDINSKYADLQHDIKTLPDIFKNHFWEIRISHAIEHFYLKEWPKIINEWLKALKPGGIIRISLPDLEIIIKTLLNDNNRDMKNRPVLSLKKGTAAMAQIYGINYDDPATDNRWRHRLVVNEKTMTRYLLDCFNISAVYRCPKDLDSAVLHNINDDSQNSWSMTIVGIKQANTYRNHFDKIGRYQTKIERLIPQTFQKYKVYGLIYNDYGQFLTIKSKDNWRLPHALINSYDDNEKGIIEKITNKINISIGNWWYYKIPNNDKILFFTARVLSLKKSKFHNVSEKIEFMLPREMIDLNSRNDKKFVSEIVNLLLSSY